MNESIVRTLSGVVYIALLLAATLYSPFTFMLLFGIFMLIAITEFCRLAKISLISPLLSGGILFVLYAVNLNNDILTHTSTIIAVATGIFLIAGLFAKKPLISGSSFIKRLLVPGYIVFPFLLIIKLPMLGGGYISYIPNIIIGAFIIIWTNDTFAYIVGRLVGKHKLFERISPKKTIEGFIGGLIFAIICSYILSIYYDFLSPVLWIISGIILVVFGTLGDLIESQLKRNAGVKDSGTIMPGHGGILDRLDSIIFAIPFLFLFHQIINYVS